MSSPLFLESLEERALLSGPTAEFVSPLSLDPWMVRFAASGQTDPNMHNRVSSLASEIQELSVLLPIHNPTLALSRGLASEIQELSVLLPHLGSVGKDLLGDLNSAEGVSRGEATPLLSKLSRVSGFADGPGNAFPLVDALLTSEADYRMRELDPDGLRLTEVAMVVNSVVVDALESRDRDKISDEDIRSDRDSDFRRQDPDATAADHGPGSQGANGVLVGNPARPLDDLMAALDLFDPNAGLEAALLPGPLADSVFLDGWRDGVPPPQADLVPAAGHDLTVMATYLVGTAPKSTPANQALAAVDPGPTDFIVGLSASRTDQGRGQALAIPEAQGNQRQVVPWESELVQPIATKRRDAAVPTGEQRHAILSQPETPAVPSVSAPAEVVSNKTGGAESTWPLADREDVASDEGAATP